MRIPASHERGNFHKPIKNMWNYLTFFEDRCKYRGHLEPSPHVKDIMNYYADLTGDNATAVVAFTELAMRNLLHKDNIALNRFEMAVDLLDKWYPSLNNYQYYLKNNEETTEQSVLELCAQLGRRVDP